MQLGELQSQYERFRARDVEVIAISVDPGNHSRAMIRRMGLEFPVLSDEDQSVMKAFGVQNPDTRELALHAVYIVDEDREIIYRKVASRRPKSQELLDAIDYARGRYPLGDEQMTYRGTAVAFPKNNFQALIEVANNRALPETMDKKALEEVVTLIRTGRLDDATIRYRQLMVAIAPQHTRDQLLSVAAWLADAVVALPEEARLTGRALSQALVTQRTLGADDQATDEQRQAAARDLETLRSVVRKNAGRWNLSRLKTTLRGYRELSLAAMT